MSPRTAAEVEALFRRLGRDIRLDWAGPAGAFTDGDVAVERRVAGPRGRADIATTSGVDSAVQFLVNRLMTRRGELEALGHPDYGSRHHELVGEPNTERTRNLVKLYVLDALRREPRAAEVLRCTVRSLPHDRTVVRIELAVRLIDASEPLNLVVPFDLGDGA